MDYDLIKTLCKRRGISENKLAIAIGYTGPGYYRMIKTRNLTISSLEKIAEVLNVQPSLFFKDTEPKINEPEVKYTDKPEEVTPEYLLNKIRILEEKVKELYDEKKSGKKKTK